MAITATRSLMHWNYFLALEKDMEVVSRYIEFCKENFDVFSIELAHILFAAASEVDVVAKLLCKLIQTDASPVKICEYRAIILPAIPLLPQTEILVPRYELPLKPWESWSESTRLKWWRSYNNVKHQRDAHFKEATLENALNALGALLIIIFHYYSRKLSDNPTKPLYPKKVTEQLNPESTFLRFAENMYYTPLTVDYPKL